MKTRLTNVLLGTSLCLCASHFLHAQQKSSARITSGEKVQQIQVLGEANPATLELQNSTTYKLPTYTSAKGTTNLVPKEDKKRLATEFQKQKLREVQSLNARKESVKTTLAVNARLATFNKMTSEIESTQKKTNSGVKNPNSKDIEQILKAKKLAEMQRLELLKNKTNQPKR